MLKRLYAKYNGMAEPIKASMWFLLCGFIQKGMSSLTTPIFTRLMTAPKYGRISVYHSWYNIFFIIASLELASGVYTKGLVRYEEDADAFSSSLLSLSTLCTFVFSIIYFFFNGIINRLTGISTYLMVLMIIEIWTTIAYQFWSSRERVAYRYKRLVALMLTFTFLRPIIAVIAVILSDPLRQVEARITSTVIINLFLFTGLYISMMKKGKVFYNKKYWKHALLFNLPLIPHYLSQIILNQADRIMINNLCGPAEAGFYSVAYSLAMVMQIFNTSVASTMNPWIYRSIKDKSYARIGSVSYTVLIAIAGLNFLMVALGPELLRIMAPGNYYQAVWCIPPIAVSVYFTFLYNLFATFEYYFNKTVWVMVASGVGAVTNIILNFIFIPKFGFIAAGYTTLVSYILYALMHYIFMSHICDKYMEKTKVYELKKILAIGFLLLVASGIMLCLYSHTILRYSVLATILVVAFFFKNRFIQVFTEIKKK